MAEYPPFSDDADLLAYYAGELTELVTISSGSGAAPDYTRIAAARKIADTAILTNLSAKYPRPYTNKDDTVALLSCRLTVYELWRVYASRSRNVGLPDRVQKDYDAALRDLKSIREGLITVNLTNPNDETATDLPINSILAVHQDYDIMGTAKGTGLYNGFINEDSLL